MKFGPATTRYFGRVVASDGSTKLYERNASYAAIYDVAPSEFDCRDAVRAAVCVSTGCFETTTLTHQNGETRWVVQHGPNPEHVLLVDKPAFLSIEQDWSSGAWGISVDDWLRRIHEVPA